MKQLHVKTVDSEYPVIIKEGLFQNLLDYIPSLEKYQEFVVLSDENVYTLYGEMIDQQIYKTEKPVETIVIPAGDESKCLEIYEQVLTSMLERYISRNALLIAFGGGMVGDFGGFVAATYMRGIDFIQVPTTLLAHDSAVGGKVALNHPLAKNVIGAFYQPKAVLYDPHLLQTLPDIEWISGFAEVQKHSEIDSTFVLPDIKTLEDMKQVDMYLAEAIEVKRKIVERDPFEQGDRIFLNYGHTFGHALEQHMNYELPHGICVLYGLIFVALLEKRTAKPYQDILGMISLPTLKLSLEDFDILFTYMKRDKKQKEGFSFLLKHKDTFKMKEISEKQLKDTFTEFIRMV